MWGSAVSSPVQDQFVNVSCDKRFNPSPSTCHTVLFLDADSSINTVAGPAPTQTAGAAEEEEGRTMGGVGQPGEGVQDMERPEKVKIRNFSSSSSLRIRLTKGRLRFRLSRLFRGSSRRVGSMTRWSCHQVSCWNTDLGGPQSR